jgi:hypothetical protein
VKSPAFQFYPAEFLSDENVALMNNQELGCYIRLMCYCWREGSIPSDIKKIAKLCGEDGSAMAQLWDSIKLCFKLGNGSSDRLIHPRLEKERLKQEAFKKERSESGQKGAKHRWNKDIDDFKNYSSANGSAIKEPIAKHSSSSSSSSSSTEYNTNTVVNTYMSSCEKIYESKSGLKTNEKESEIFNYWKEKLEHPKSVLDKKRLIAIRARLKEGYTVERIKEAIDGIKNSPHNMGQNDRNTVFDDIELICRSGANVDRFADMKKGAQNVSKLKFDKRTEGVRAFMQEQSRIRSIRSGANDSSGSLPEPRNLSGEVNGDV